MSRRPPDPAAWLEPLAALAREAGRAVMAVYDAPFEVRGKADASPVTEADLRAEAVITDGLARLAPGIPVVAEEAVAAGAQPVAAERFWLVDPLDGTREFVGRNGEFTVNIALVEHGAPVLGVVLAPALGAAGELYAGAVGHGAWMEDAAGRRAIACRRVPAEGPRVLASRSHGDEAALQAWLGANLDGQAPAGIGRLGSSLKLCLIARGEADLYPRLGPTMAWDIAAGHAVLAAAGGSVCDLQGAPLRYDAAALHNPHFVARGG